MRLDHLLSREFASEDATSRKTLDPEQTVKSVRIKRSARISRFGNNEARKSLTTRQFFVKKFVGTSVLFSFRFHSLTVKVRQFVSQLES